MNNKSVKKILFRVFFIIEILAFSFTFLFGTKGVNVLMKINHENNDLVSEIDLLKNELKDIQTQIKEFQNDPFYKEEIARTKLQLSKEGDEIYYII